MYATLFYEVPFISSPCQIAYIYREDQLVERKMTNIMHVNGINSSWIHLHNYRFAVEIEINYPVKIWKYNKAIADRSRWGIEYTTSGE